jgi:hypothetical protein
MKDNKTMKDTLVYAVEIVNSPASRTQIFESYFIPNIPDIYKFTLKMSKDGKDFEVKFVVRVKKYNFRLFKEENSESYGIDFIFPTGFSPLVLGSKSENTENTEKTDDDGITYSSGDNPTTFNNYEIMKGNPQPFTIVQRDPEEKKYMFPIKYPTNFDNNSFFSSIRNKMIKKILEKYKAKLSAVLDQLLQQQPTTPQLSQADMYYGNQ